MPQLNLKNTKESFGLVAICLHWLMAFLIIGLLILGLYMVELPISLQKLKLYGWHKEYGLLVLFLFFLRLSWRILNTTPELPIVWWEKLAARLVHWIFYGFMLALPVTGWLLTSAAGLPVSFFGWFTLPNLVAPDESLRQTLTVVHKYLAYALIATIGLHVLAALKHHFIDKDNVLRRMIS